MSVNERLQKALEACSSGRLQSLSLTWNGVDKRWRVVVSMGPGQYATATGKDLEQTLGKAAEAVAK